jgi:hypothetical protein
VILGVGQFAFGEDFLLAWVLVVGYWVFGGLEEPQGWMGLGARGLIRARVGR